MKKRVLALVLTVVLTLSLTPTLSSAASYKLTANQKKVFQFMVECVLAETSGYASVAKVTAAKGGIILFYYLTEINSSVRKATSNKAPKPITYTASKAQLTFSKAIATTAAKGFFGSDTKAVNRAVSDIVKNRKKNSKGNYILDFGDGPDQKISTSSGVSKDSKGSITVKYSLSYYDYSPAVNYKAVFKPYKASVFCGYYLASLVKC